MVILMWNHLLHNDIKEFLWKNSFPVLHHVICQLSYLPRFFDNSAPSWCGALFLVLCQLESSYSLLKLVIFMNHSVHSILICARHHWNGLFWIFAHKHSSHLYFSFWHVKPTDRHFSHSDNHCHKLFLCVCEFQLVYNFLVSTTLLFTALWRWHS